MPQQHQHQNELSPLLRSLPLYAGLGFPERNDSRGYSEGLLVDTPHPGLVFDKFIDTWKITADGRCVIQDPESKNAKTELKLGSKRAWLEETLKLVKTNKGRLDVKLATAIERQKKLIDALDGKCVEVKTDWRFVSGLGNGHPFETGFIWHRTLGVPYLPGSSVKGLMRAWAAPKKSWGDEKTLERIKRLFGDAKDDGAGSLIVFDALPVEVPIL
ncbi:MAG: RAMP superfamily CRISPR-associated protein, partial [Gammaproteobacteria bacterium]